MSEHTDTAVATLTASTIYSFPRHIRYGPYGPATDAADTIRSRDTIRLLRRTYRALRRAGLEDYEARIDLWLLLTAPVEQLQVERRPL